MNFTKGLRATIGLIAAVIVIFALDLIFFDKNGTLFGSNPQQNKNELALDTIVINIQGGDFSYIKVDLSFEGEDKKSSQKMRSNKEYIRKMMIQLLEKQNGRKILQEKNKIKLKNEIKKEIEQNIGVHVKDVYFRNFILAP